MTFNDRTFGALLLTLAVAYGWGATQLPEPFGGAEAVGPETFPHLLAAVLAVCSLCLIVRPDPDNAWPWGRTGAELLIAVAVLIIYTALLQPVGFILSTLLAVGTLCWRMGAPPLKAYAIGSVALVPMLTFGVAGYLLRKLEIPLVPIILGLLLGPEMEKNLRHAMDISSGDWTILWDSGLAIGLWIFAGLGLVQPYIMGPLMRHRMASETKAVSKGD